MKKPAALRVTLPLCLLALRIARLDAQSAPSQMPPDGELSRAIASLDAAVFDSYNRCDPARFGTFFTADVEFICGKVRRELVQGTLEVYPVHGCGALEIGVHRFHHAGAEDKRPVGEAKSIHLRAYKDGTWKITRIISFAHHASPK